MKHELFFTLYLTENEHYIVEGIISEECQKFGCELVYYRKFKNGHHPGYREVKIQSKEKSDLNKLAAYLSEHEGIDTKANRHKELEEYIAKEIEKYTSKANE